MSCSNNIEHEYNERKPVPKQWSDVNKSGTNTVSHILLTTGGKMCQEGKFLK